MKRIEAEKNELVLQNESGDYAIIPADRRAEVQQLLKDGCYECIDKIVSELPAMADYANEGTVVTDPPIKQNTNAYREAYNKGNLTSYNKEKDTYIAPTMKSVKVVEQQPNWMKFREQYISDNPPTNNTVDESYNNKLYSKFVDSLLDDFSFEFTDKEQELVDKYAKTKRDKSAYQFFKEKSGRVKSKKENLKESVSNLTFDTFTDQLPDIVKRFRGNKVIDEILKLPHINKLKALKTFAEGRPITALSELAKIPDVSNILGDAVINLAQDNPEVSIQDFEDEYISLLRLASPLNRLAKQIHEESSAKKLPNIIQSRDYFKEKYGITGNDFTEFIENYMPRGKSYEETLKAYETYLEKTKEKVNPFNIKAEDGMVISNPASDGYYTPIQSFLDKYNSPMTVDDFVSVSQETGIGVDALLTQALLESSLGTKGKGARSNNPLNWGNDDEGNIRSYGTYREGLLTAAKGLKEKFYFTTPEDFMERNFQGKYGIYATDPEYKTKYGKYLNIVRDSISYTPTYINDSNAVQSNEQTVQGLDQPTVQKLEDESIKIMPVKPNSAGFLSNATPYSSKKPKMRVSQEDVQLKQILSSQGFVTPGTSLDATTLKVAFIENSGKLDKFAKQDLNELATKLNSI